MDKELFDKLFNELETYEEIPNMIRFAVNDCVRSEYDSIKKHAICYHIAGIAHIVNEVKSILNELENEVIILGIDIEEEMDVDAVKKYLKLKEFLKTF